MRATAIEQGLKTFQEAQLALARGRGRETSSRLALAVGLAIVIALAGAEWHASRSAWRTQSWPAHLERFALALAENDLEAAADAWAEAYHGVMEADGGWRGPVALGQAWQELVRRSRNEGAILSGPRQLYLTAMVRARDAGDLEGILVTGNAMRDLGDRDAAEECLRIARGLATARPVEGWRTKLEAFEATLAAGHGEPEVGRLAR
jgi:hypothetical protein